jgi:S1-C subfamily serine protease
VVVTRRTWLLLSVVVVVLLVAVAGGTYWWAVRHAIPAAANSEPGETESLASIEQSAEPGKPDPYSAPADIPALIREVTRETVFVTCSNEGYGAGWVLDTTAEPVVRNEDFRAAAEGLNGLVVTALHVVENCRDNTDGIRVRIGDATVRSQLLNWHRKTDLAILAVGTGTPGLEPIFTAVSGAWVLAIGTPFSNQLTPTIGRTITTEGNDLYSDILTNTGNSGGPLVNSQGQVIGTVTAGLIDEDTGMNLNVSVATKTRALCQKLLEC